MKTTNILIAFLFCMLVFLDPISKPIFAQSEAWEETIVVAHTVVSFNINAARMYDHFEGEKSRTEVETFLKNEMGIELSEVDQFQSFISTAPELGFGADDAGHHQVTFRKAKEFDAKSIGAMSGYKLTEEKIGERTTFMGDQKRKGSWGGLVVNDRTVLFAVRRKMNSILESQDIEKAAEHDLSEISKDNRDILVTLSGGDKIKAVYENAWHTQEHAEVFDLYTSAQIEYDSQSETPLSATFHSKDEATAEQLEIKFHELATMAERMLKQLQEMYQRLDESDQRKTDTDSFIAILQSLNISSEKSTVTISSNEEVAQQLPQMLIRMALQ